MYYFKLEFEWRRDLIAGAIACAFSNTISAPLERLKYQLQLRGPTKSAIVNSIKEIVKYGGVRSLWAGNGANLLKLVPQSAVRLVMFRSILGDLTQERTSLSVFLCGAAAGATSQMIMYPVEVLRIRMTIAKPGTYNGILHAAKHLYETGGWKVFYRGFMFNALLSIPYFGVKFALMDAILRKYRDDKSKSHQMLVNICAVGISSTVALSLVYPGFLIRTILQTSSSLKAKSVLAYTWKKRGLRGLYSGMGVTIIRVFDVAGTTFITFIHINDILKEIGI